MRLSDDAMPREKAIDGSSVRPGPELVRPANWSTRASNWKRGPFTRTEMFGADSVEVEKAARACVTHYNTAGMMLLLLEPPGPGTLCGGKTCEPSRV